MMFERLGSRKQGSAQKFERAIISPQNQLKFRTLNI
jgi:hypothetical protein